MKFQETETVELKAVAQDGIKKEIVAFANSNGGTVYVGVGDDGTVLGVEDADGCALQVSNMVRDAVRPDVTMFVSYETLNCDGKAVVAVKVQRGTNRPYYMAKKGLRPEGVYVRQGYSSVPATDAAIRQMIKETDGDSFEDMALAVNRCVELGGGQVIVRSGKGHDMEVHIDTDEANAIAMRGTPMMEVLP